MIRSKFLFRWLLPAAGALSFLHVDAASAEPSGAFQQHYEAAVRLFLSERYADALKEFEAAYAAQKWPRLLINIGTTHRKLGEAKAALTAYEAYLRLEPHPEPEVKKKLDEALAQVRTMLNASAAHNAIPKPAAPGKRTAKPILTPADTGIDRFRPEAYNKPTLQSVAAVEEHGIWAVGTLGTVVHFDGNNFSDGASAWRSDLKHLFGNAANDVWAVGSAGMILHFDGNEWFRVPSGTDKIIRGIWTAAAPTSTGALPADAWALDEQGTLLHFDGTNWLELLNNSTEQTRIAAVYTGAQGNVWAVGPAGVILRWDGKNMVSVVSGTTKGLAGVWSNDRNDVWAVGAEATLLHNIGKGFVPVSAGVPAQRPVRPQSGGGNYAPTNNFYTVYCSSPKDVWVGGGAEGPGEGFILHLENQSFVPVVPATKGMILGLWGSGPRDIWAVGNAGLIMHYDGTAWSNQARQTSDDLRAVWGTGPADVWAAGSSGALLHYDGQSWSNAYTRAEDALNRVFASDATNVWAIG